MKVTAALMLALTTHCSLGLIGITSLAKAKAYWNSDVLNVLYCQEVTGEKHKLSIIRAIDRMIESKEILL